jgi:hypothetical protein
MKLNKLQFSLVAVIVVVNINIGIAVSSIILTFLSGFFFGAGIASINIDDQCKFPIFCQQLKFQIVFVHAFKSPLFESILAIYYEQPLHQHARAKKVQT